MIEEAEKSGRPYIFRYRPNNEFTLDEIENSYIFFQKRELLNDPFDSTPDLIDLKEFDINQLFKLFETLAGEENKNLIKKNIKIEELEKTVRESIPKFINKHGIACFSMFPGINMPLLANYSNNHKGLYFQYNIELDSNFFKGLRPMNYQKVLNKIPIEILKNQNDIFKVFYLKQDNWSYEEELRLVKENSGKYKINRTALRNIICGYDCPEDYILEVIKANKQNKHVSIWKMEKPLKHNNLIFNLIE
ncbi:MULTISPECIES: hypothetical protein [Tenacibaculum]|uniref:Uncharacterized protein n=1 Tax=Tenacibaculum finnmarkense genomovar ulcerans TaxID=2781388 RepID=A0A2I2MCQ7_9FLAO|nr:hypothetical protein [Tenacibaculum finnmarkense]SOU89897.1 conserved hypothetical protein [Tenacibaculum finnmarkense genomovar ulcerans]